MENKLKKHDRMARAEKEEKKSSRSLRKKRGSGAQDDDDDVDSKGNIRGLIAYSEESEEETPRSKRKGGFKPRKNTVPVNEMTYSKKSKKSKKLRKLKRFREV